MIAALALTALVLGASPDGGLPGRVGTLGPSGFTVPGLKVRVVADEGLDPDALGALARPGVSLWLKTKSNALRSSVAERLPRFESAWVEVRAPVLAGQAATLARAPAVGLWVALKDARGAGLFRLGPRPLAVRFEGPLDEARANALSLVRPARIAWHPAAADLDLESFSRFVHLPGAKTLVLPADAKPPACDADVSQTATRAWRLRVAVRSAEAAESVAACGLPVRLRIPVEIDPARLLALFKAAPDAELELDVGDDAQQAFRAARLVQALQGPPPPRQAQ